MPSPIKKISILGCGWLGFSLALELIRAGYEVLGSTTSAEKLPRLKEAGIQSFLIRVGTQLEGEPDDFFQTDLLILNIPPGRRRLQVETIYPEEIRLLMERALESGIKRLIFISSTGVYADTNRTVTESDEEFATGGSGLALLRCEQYLRALPGLQLTILRLAGLVGGERKAGRFLAGKKNVPNGDAPVNMVHRDDVVQVISTIIREQVWNDTFNVCTDGHPVKKEFYRLQAEKEGLEPPVFVDGGPLAFKVIANTKLKTKLKYSFLHPDPLQF